MIKTFSTIEAREDYLLSMTKLGQRWSCHPKVALRRVKQFGLCIIRFNARAHAVKLSDVLRLEQEASVSSVPLTTAAGEEK
jgi:hypothetical protein